VRQVAILGPPGAGKSWLARELAEILDLPVVHLDRL
jgi:adenylate kinase family enzyme